MTAILQNETASSNEEIMLLDLKFHATILEVSGNELLAQIGHTMRQALLTARQSDRHDIESQKNSLPSHQAILQAIAEHRADNAYQHAQEHINKVWHDMRRGLSEKQVL